MSEQKNIDFLKKIEKETYKDWDEQRTFWTKWPALPRNNPYFLTIPSPSLNGKLTLGSTAPYIIADFHSFYQRMLGKNVLFCSGFHCYEDSIAIKAKNLTQEIGAYGNPPKFPGPPHFGGPCYSASSFQDRKQTCIATHKWFQWDADLELKEYQWDKLLQNGVTYSDIIEFRDPNQWYRHFPEDIKKDMMNLGISFDVRRPFLSHIDNPYYKSFVTWQLKKLEQTQKIQYQSNTWIINYENPEWCENVLNLAISLNLDEAILEKIRMKFNTPLLVSGKMGIPFYLDPDQKISGEIDFSLYAIYLSVSHYLQFGNLDPDKVVPGPALIYPRDLSDAFWDYIFLNGPVPKTQSGVNTLVLKNLKDEGHFWLSNNILVDYDLDNLITTLFQYVAILPKKYWPKHVSLIERGESTEHVTDLIQKWSASAIRLSIATGSSDLHQCVQNLTNQMDWIKEQQEDWLVQGYTNPMFAQTKELTMIDKIYENKLNSILQKTLNKYKEADYGAVVHLALNNITQATKQYLTWISSTDAPNYYLIKQSIELQARLLVPIVPHWSDWVWRKVLGRQKLIFTNTFSTKISVYDVITKAEIYLDRILELALHAMNLHQKSQEKPTRGIIHIFPKFNEIQEKIILLQKQWYPDEIDFDTLSEDLTEIPVEKLRKFVYTIQTQIRLNNGEFDINQEPIFSEEAILSQVIPVLLERLQLESLEIKINTDSENICGFPYNPQIHFY